MIAAPETTAWYVYGVVDASAKIGADQLRLIGEGPLAAVVSEVPLSEFGEEELAQRLNDRAWLEEHARAHEDVLQRLAAVAAVVPFRFGAIYRELDDVSVLLRERRGELSAALERVRGRIELGVKAWADRDRFEAALGDALPEPSSGRAYLERRRTEHERAGRVGAQLGDIARDAHARLLRHAVEGVANRPHPRELTGRDEALAGEAAALDAEHGARGIAFEVTGPWPPHNFVEPRDEV